MRREARAAHAVALAERVAAVVAVDACADVDTVPYRQATWDDFLETERQVGEMGSHCVPVELDVRDARMPAGDGCADDRSRTPTCRSRWARRRRRPRNGPTCPAGEGSKNQARAFLRGDAPRGYVCGGAVGLPCSGKRALDLSIIVCVSHAADRRSNVFQHKSFRKVNRCERTVRIAVMRQSRTDTPDVLDGRPSGGVDRNGEVAWGVTCSRILSRPS